MIFCAAAVSFLAAALATADKTVVCCSGVGHGTADKAFLVRCAAMRSVTESTRYFSGGVSASRSTPQTYASKMGLNSRLLKMCGGIGLQPSLTGVDRDAQTDRSVVRDPGGVDLDRAFQHLSA